MRAALRRILDEQWVVVLAAGIALGYTLLNLGQAVATMIVRALDEEADPFAGENRLLAFTVADRVIDLTEIVAWLISTGIVLLVVAFAVARMRRPTPGRMR